MHRWVWFYQQNARDPLDRDRSNGTCSLVCQYIIIEVSVDSKVESGAAMAALVCQYIIIEVSVDSKVESGCPGVPVYYH